MQEGLRAVGGPQHRLERLHHLLVVPDPRRIFNWPSVNPAWFRSRRRLRTAGYPHSRNRRRVRAAGRRRYPRYFSLPSTTPECDSFFAKQSRPANPCVSHHAFAAPGVENRWFTTVIQNRPS